VWTEQSEVRPIPLRRASTRLSKLMLPIKKKKKKKKKIDTKKTKTKIKTPSFPYTCKHARTRKPSLFHFYPLSPKSPETKNTNQNRNSQRQYPPSISAQPRLIEIRKTRCLLENKNAPVHRPISTEPPGLVPSDLYHHPRHRPTSSMPLRTRLLSRSPNALY